MVLASSKPLRLDQHHLELSGGVDVDHLVLLAGALGRLLGLFVLLEYYMAKYKNIIYIFSKILHTFFPQFDNLPFSDGIKVYILPYICNIKRIFKKICLYHGKYHKISYQKYCKEKRSKGLGRNRYVADL